MHSNSYKVVQIKKKTYIYFNQGFNLLLFLFCPPEQIHKKN